jgi:hypothetical protein
MQQQKSFQKNYFKKVQLELETNSQWKKKEGTGTKLTKHS